MGVPLFGGKPFWWTFSFPQKKLMSRKSLYDSNERIWATFLANKLVSRRKTYVPPESERLKWMDLETNRLDRPDLTLPDLPDPTRNDPTDPTRPDFTRPNQAQPDSTRLTGLAEVGLTDSEGSSSRVSRPPAQLSTPNRRDTSDLKWPEPRWLIEPTDTSA